MIILKTEAKFFAYLSSKKTQNFARAASDRLTQGPLRTALCASSRGLSHRFLLHSFGGAIVLLCILHRHGRRPSVWSCRPRRGVFGHPKNPSRFMTSGERPKDRPLGWTSELTSPGPPTDRPSLLGLGQTVRSACDVRWCEEHSRSQID
jgi:hypothetical protein